MPKAVLVTAPREEARDIAETLVEERLAACVNAVDVDSVYRWKGDVETAEETQLIIKTTDDAVPDLARRVEELHSYDLPEILTVELGGSTEYLDWIKGVTGDA